MIKISQTLKKKTLAEMSGVMTDQHYHDHQHHYLMIEMTTNLEEEDAGTDERGDDRPASDEEVTWVVADHVVHRESEPPGQMMMII